VRVLVAGMELVVREGEVSSLRLWLRLRSFGYARLMSDDGFDLRTVAESKFPVDVLFSAEIHEKDGGDGDEDYGWDPRVVGPVACHAYACVGSYF